MLTTVYTQAILTTTTKIQNYVTFNDIKKNYNAQQIYYINATGKKNLSQ